MRSAKILIPIGLALLLTACGPVEWLNPCFNKEDVVFDPALVGAWHEPDGKEILKFRKADDKSYELLDTETQTKDSEPEQSRYEAHLVRLGPYLFLDLLSEAAHVKSGSYAFYPASSEDGAGFQPRFAKVGDGLYASLVPGQRTSEASHGGGAEVHLTQAHWVFRVWLNGDRLRLADLSEDRFKQAVDQGEIDIGFERIDDSLVLTASTKELRAFLLEFAGEEGAFPEDNTQEFRRRN
jgi:hypothetical protein